MKEHEFAPFFPQAHDSHHSHQAGKPRQDKRRDFPPLRGVKHLRAFSATKRASYHHGASCMLPRAARTLTTVRGQRRAARGSWLCPVRLGEKASSSSAAVTTLTKEQGVLGGRGGSAEGSRSLFVVSPPRKRSRSGLNVATDGCERCVHGWRARVCVRVSGGRGRKMWQSE